jgi:two-component system LytT family response regulator
MAYLFKAISIDDSPTDAARLKSLLAPIETVEYVGNAPTLAEGRELLQREHPDLLFLDVELPDGNGIESIRSLRQNLTWPVKIVIYTVFDDRVLEALRNDAFDYLIKPLRPSEIEGLMARLLEDYERRSEAWDEQAAATGGPYATGSIMMVNTIVGYVPIRLTDIVYAEHVDKTKYWRIFLADGTSQLLRKGTSSANILGMNRNFIQVNNRQIINLHFIGMLKKDSCLLAAPFGGTEIPVTRSYLAALQDRMTFI